MNREGLALAVHELGRRLGLDYFYVIGSAAVFAELPDSNDPAVTATRDVDVIPSPPAGADVDALTDQIDLFFGEGSDFDVQNGFYIQGVDMSTPKYAPRGWKERAVPLRAARYTAMCMEKHDLAISKYCAGRDKDLEFTRALAADRQLDKDLLLRRLPDVDIDEELRERVRARIEADFRGGGNKVRS